MTNVGTFIKASIATIGSAIATFFGGWTVGLTTLGIMLCIDFLAGITKSYLNKSLSSKIMFKGIVKKIFSLLLVLVAYRIDLVLNTTFLKDATTIALIINETLSVVENLGEIGVPIPTVIKKAIELLKDKDHTEDNDRTDEK